MVMYAKTDCMGPIQCPHVSKGVMIVISWLKPLLYRWVLATSLLAAFIGSGVLRVKPQLACIEKTQTKTWFPFRPVDDLYQTNIGLTIFLF